MRGSAEAEGFEEVGEHDLFFLRGDAEGVEHGILEVALVDPDGAAAEFVAVEDDIVGEGSESAEGGGIAGLEPGLVFGDGAGEGVVNGVPLSLLPRRSREEEIR